jgi:hypothetical protein
MLPIHCYDKDEDDGVTLDRNLIGLVSNDDSITSMVKEEVKNIVAMQNKTFSFFTDKEEEEEEEEEDDDSPFEIPDPLNFTLKEFDTKKDMEAYVSSALYGTVKG